MNRSAVGKIKKFLDDRMDSFRVLGRSFVRPCWVYFGVGCGAMTPTLLPLFSITSKFVQFHTKTREQGRHGRSICEQPLRTACVNHAECSPVTESHPVKSKYSFISIKLSMVAMVKSRCIYLDCLEDVTVTGAPPICRFNSSK